MDANSLTAAFTALDFARRAVSSAIDLRDFNKAASELAKLNEALLDAQGAMLQQNQLVFELQNEKFKAAEELRKLKEAAAERQRYSLVELATGVFVYRANALPIDGGSGNPSSSEPEHYICQPCFDGGTKVVLMRQESLGSIELLCTVCRTTYDTGGRVQTRLPF